MNKSCARCNKIVYPIEELKCLDKTWHKTCFKCHECGMTLNMKTYKGFNKLPYCEAHIPKAKATVIADTPELKRIAENTKIQSNVQYHADFEKQKGKLTQVADDPETLRIKQNTKHISNVAYHGDLEKKAAMEKQREVSEVLDNRDTESEYFSETLAAESLSQYQTISPPPPPPAHSMQSQQHNHSSPPQSQQQHLSQQQYHSQQHQQQQQQQQQSYQAQNSQIYSSHNNQMQNKQQSDYLQSKHNPIQGQGGHQQQLPQAQQQQQQQQHLQQQLHHQPQQQLQQQQQPHSQLHNNHHSNANYQSQNYPVDNFNNLRNSMVQHAGNPSGGLIHSSNSTSSSTSASMPQHQHSHSNQQLQQSSKYYDQYENYARPSGQNVPVYNNNNNNSVYSSNPSSTGYGTTAYHHQGYTNSGYSNHYNAMHYTADSGIGGGGGGGGGIGKISDYDPITDGPRTVPNATRPSSTLIYSSDRGGMVTNSLPRKIGSINDIDPANGIYGSIDQNNTHMYQQQQQQQQQPQQQQQQHQHQNQARHSLGTSGGIMSGTQSYGAVSHPSKSAVHPSGKMRVFRALYDYEAQDSDEVSFSEGDLIFEVDSIDSGWMTGRIERTGKTGMLPANYVELALI